MSKIEKKVKNLSDLDNKGICDKYIVKYIDRDGVERAVNLHENLQSQTGMVYRSDSFCEELGGEDE